jgi:two-component system response regulator FixJ
VETEQIIYIVDGDATARRSLAMALRAKGFATHAFGSAADLIEASTYIPPGCILLDLQLPDQDGLEVLRLLKQTRPEMPVIAVTGEPSIRTAVNAIKSGAADFLEKPFPISLLSRMLGQACAGLTARSGREERAREASARIARLTPRENEVLAGLLEGLSSRLLADRLSLSVRTVEMHRANLMRKLEVQSLAELTRVVISAGLSAMESDERAA